jgi:16S rRNA (guanine527-N7)-methyltransferase
MFSEFSHLWQITLDWHPTFAQEQQFEHLYNLVLEGNKTQNLTRITSPQDFWEKHLWDSLRGVTSYFGQENLNVIDIGTGAGFPGLPLAIAQPTWQVTLLDSKQKKITYVADVIEKMQLSNCCAIAGRSEEINRTKLHAQKYDLALIRAVGSVELCAQYTLPFLKSAGKAVLYRGQWSDSETAELTKTCETVGAEMRKVETFFTPLTASARHCLQLAPYLSTSV